MVEYNAKKYWQASLSSAFYGYVRVKKRINYDRICTRITTKAMTILQTLDNGIATLDLNALTGVSKQFLENVLNSVANEFLSTEKDDFDHTKIKKYGDYINAKAITYEHNT